MRFNRFVTLMKRTGNKQKLVFGLLGVSIESLRPKEDVNDYAITREDYDHDQG
jgi:hypothetical protein